MKEIQSEIPPTSPEQQEAFFQEQVAEGEKLAAMGMSLAAYMMDDLPPVLVGNISLPFSYRS